MINIFDLMSEQVAKSEEKQYDQLKSISNSSKYQAFGEDGEFDSSSGFEDFVDGGTSLDGGQDSGFDAGGGFDDFGGGDGFGGDQDGQGNMPKDALEFLENVDESEVHIVEDTLAALSNIYHDQLDVYKRLMEENLDASDHSEDIKRIREQYQITLEVLKDYIQNKYKKETTLSRVETLLKFKSIFNKCADNLNAVLADIE